MATGIKIYNDAGTVQIDELYSNFVLISKTSGTVSVPGTVGTGYVDWAVAADVACIAVTVWPETFMVLGSLVSGGTWTFRVQFYNNPDTTGTCNYSLWAFGKPPAASETIGLKVLNSSGGLIFHSQHKPLRVLSAQTNLSSYSAPAGRTIAALPLELSIYGEPGGVESNTLRCNGSLIQPLRISVVAGNPLGTSRDGLYAAIDVTHY